MVVESKIEVRRRRPGWQALQLPSLVVFKAATPLQPAHPVQFTVGAPARVDRWSYRSKRGPAANPSPSLRPQPYMYKYRGSDTKTIDRNSHWVPYNPTKLKLFPVSSDKLGLDAVGHVWPTVCIPPAPERGHGARSVPSIPRQSVRTIMQ